MRLLNHIPAWLKNKYFISFAAFCVIMLFLDKNDIFTQTGRRNELNEWQQKKKYYTKEIKELRKEADELANNPGAIEKTSREKFYMKRDNEELFIIPENYDNPRN
ncbi:MAG TPA: septum formation initiator family protein [Chitinophagaceae bacterium]|nr:septum formation initiator family protein [Chitinophagaceae bacterium]